jgi:hypothetical protein
MINERAGNSPRDGQLSLPASLPYTITFKQSVSDQKMSPELVVL